MHANYDSVAGIYDRLARLVFGDALFNSQLFPLQHIPVGSRILIVGGGTGWILEEIAKLQGSGLEITYVELSQRMLALSKKQYVAENKLCYLQGAIQEVKLQGTFDVLITPFFFDNFSNQALEAVFAKLHAVLKPGGRWLFADFQLQESKIGQRLLLKLMYLFFRLLCRLEASRLPDSALFFSHYGYVSISEACFYGGFIQSIVYRKKGLQ